MRLFVNVQSVGRDRNYAVRATKQSEDEFGQFTDDFNEMLGQLQARDEALAPQFRAPTQTAPR